MDLIALQPFSQKFRTPTVPKDFQISLFDPAEADLEHFWNCCSAGFLRERLYDMLLTLPDRLSFHPLVLPPPRPPETPPNRPHTWRAQGRPHTTPPRSTQSATRSRFSTTTSERAALRRAGSAARSGVTPCPLGRGLASRLAPLGHAPVGSPLPQQARLTEASQMIRHRWSK